MQIVIRLIVLVRGYEVLSNGSLPVKEWLYKEDPDKEAARVAIEWINKEKRQMHVEGIIKVIYEDKKDITKLVKQQID
jgi:hypothetical protein